MNHTSLHVCTHPRRRERQERALARLLARVEKPERGRGREARTLEQWAANRDAEIAKLKSILGIA